MSSIIEVICWVCKRKVHTIGMAVCLDCRLELYEEAKKSKPYTKEQMAMEVQKIIRNRGGKRNK